MAGRVFVVERVLKDSPALEDRGVDSHQGHLAQTFGGRVSRSVDEGLISRAVLIRRGLHDLSVLEFDLESLHESAVDHHRSS